MTFNDIKHHAKHDLNAPKHMYLGALGSVLFGVSIFAGLLASPVFYSSITVIIYVGAGFVLGGFLTGIAIEVIQRIQRTGGIQNTVRESILDALVTGLWFIYIWHYG